MIRYILAISISLLLLSYPGNIPFFETFAYKSNLFNKKNTSTKVIKDKTIYIPTLINKRSVPKVSAKSIFICEKNTLTPLYRKNIKLKLYPASTTKLITALVAIDVFKPYQIIKVKKVFKKGEIMGLLSGEKISVENLLRGMLIQSGNDAAYALANAYGYKKFIKLMNIKAKKIGMKNTHFTNPAGLNNSNHYTTAFDMALAAHEFLKNKYLSSIAATKEIIVSDVDFKHFHKLVNINKLLGEVKGLGGLKTGYTKEAGENLISFYKKNGHEFIIVVLKSKDRFKDTQILINWINQNIKFVKFNLNELQSDK